MSRLKSGTLASSGMSQNPVVATIVYSVGRLPSISFRPSDNQATSISARPPHRSTDETTSPWPNRSQDR